MIASYPHPPLGYAEAHSVNNTPAPTPPPPRPASQHQQQQQMVYNMNGGNPMANGGMMAAPNSYGGYAEQNVFPQPNYYVNGNKPQIYTVSAPKVDRRRSLC